MGRPKGSTNKKPVGNFEKQLAEWDKKENKVDFKDLCQKLQNALAKSYVDIEVLEQTVNEQVVIIKYLEGKIRGSYSV